MGGVWDQSEWRASPCPGVGGGRQDQLRELDGRPPCLGKEPCPRKGEGTCCQSGRPPQ